MPLYEQVDQGVLDLAHEVMAYPCHGHLARARIGFIFQSPPSIRGGFVVNASAQRIGERQQAAGLPLDFLITIARERWDPMGPEWRMALLDHELSHCGGNLIDGWRMRQHDVQEFAGVIDRHGLWESGLQRIGEIIQARLPLETESPDGPARLVAVDVDDLMQKLNTAKKALKAHNIEL